MDGITSSSTQADIKKDSGKEIAKDFGSILSRLKKYLLSSSKFKLFIIASSLVILCSILTLCIVIVIAITSKKKGSDTLVVEGVGQEIVEELNRQLVYSSDATGEQSYYSPTLDLLLTYPSEKFRFSEGYDYISLYLKNVSYKYELYGTISLYNSKDDVLGIENEYKDRYTNVEVVTDDNTNDYIIFQLKYAVPDYLEEGKTNDKVLYVISKQVDTKYVTIEIEFNPDFDITNYVEDFKSILDKVEISPQNVETETIIEIPETDYIIKFDRKRWDIVTQTDYYFSISFRSSDYETNPKDKYRNTTLSVSQISLYDQITREELVNDYVDPDLESIQDIYSDDNLQIISTGNDKTIGGINFIEVVYSYDSYDTKTTRYEYYGINEESGTLINITITIDGENTVGGQEIFTILNSLQKNEQKTGYADNKQVLGTSTDSGKIEVQKSAILGKLATVHILALSCIDIKIETNSELQYLSGKNYYQCAGGTGTGFYINKDGYIATNSHVANMPTLDVVLNSISAESTKNELLIDLASQVYQVLADQGYSEEELSGMSDELLIALSLKLYQDLEKEGIITISVDHENYVEGNEPFEIKLGTDKIELANSKAHYKAETIDAKEIEGEAEIYIKVLNNEEFGITVPDVTILKIKRDDVIELPALNLIDPSQITPGQAIQVIGYPGSAQNETLFSASAATIPTITNGTVSAIKPNVDNTFNLIQIDASISFGNSGGPIINQAGEVVGLLTYGINPSEDESADFNAGVSVEELLKMTEKNNIQNDIGQVSEDVISGMNNFSKEYYSWAIDDFNKVIEEYPPAKDILNPLIKISQSKVDAGEDKSPAFVYKDIELSKTQFLIIIVAVSVIVITVLLILLLVITIKLFGMLFKKGNKLPPQGDLYSPPVEPVTNNTIGYNPLQQPIQQQVQQENNQQYMPK